MGAEDRRALSRRIGERGYRRLLRTPGTGGAAIGAVAVSMGLVVMFVLDNAHVSGDQGFFLYTGLMSAEGYVVYLYKFDIKGPVFHLLTWGLALVSGRRPAVLYVLSIALSALLTVGIFSLTEYFVNQVTGSAAAGVVASSSLLASDIWLLPIGGLYVKSLAAFLVLLAFVLFQKRRLVAAGVVAALGAGVWQLVAPVYVLGLLYVVWRGSWDRVLALLAVSVGITAAVLVPFYLTGSLTAMLSQVLWPLFASPSGYSLSHFAQVPIVLGQRAYLSLLSVLGYASLLYAGFRDATAARFAGVCALVLWLIATTSDNVDGHDFVFVVPLLAIGIGLLVGQRVPEGTVSAHLKPSPVFVGVLVGAAAVMNLPPAGELPSFAPNRLEEMYYSATPPESCTRATSYAEKFQRAVPEMGRKCWNPTVGELLQWLSER